MSRYLGISPINEATTLHEFVKSADPVDLQNRVNAAFARLDAALPGALVAGLTLAGAGDGHTFSVLIVASTEVVVGTPSISCALATVACYAGADEAALAVARAAVMPAFIAAVGAGAYQDSQLVGSSKGTRFMGMLVGETA